MRCDQCKHWVNDPNDKRHKYPPATQLGLGLCAKADMLLESTEWRSKNERPLDFESEVDGVFYPERKFDAAHEDVKMFVQDASDYRADLWTKPDFFCAHFEHKA
jgi:hypothetical protein